MSLTQITTGGVDENINIDSNTLKVDGTNNRVGINTATPSAPLDVVGNDGIALQSSAQTNEFLIRPSSSSADGIRFTQAGGGGDRMVIDSSGNVGIGTSSANALLDVNGQARFGGNKVTLDTDGSISGTISNSTTRAFVLSNTNVNADYFGGRVIQVGPDGTVNIGGSAGTSPSSYSSPNIKLNPAGSSYINGGSLGIGTAAPVRGLHLATSGNNNVYFHLTHDGTGHTDADGADLRLNRSTDTLDIMNLENAAITFHTNGENERMRIDSSGNVGVGTSSIASGGSNTTNFNVHTPSATSVYLKLSNSSTGNTASDAFDLSADSSGNAYLINRENGNMTFWTNATERVRIDSSGQLILLGNGGSTNNSLDLNYNGTSGQAQINADSNGGSTFLTFGTSSSGSLSERMRISSNGDIHIGRTGNSRATIGYSLESAFGVFGVTSNTTRAIDVNRQGNDGDLILFFQANSQEGSISVSGTTVSYNGAHLSRWSQLAGGAERTEILRGSVLSNLDEMCEWAYEAQDAVLYTEEDELPEGVSVGDVKTPAVAAGTEDNEQLNRMKVSDVEGDVNVAGVFQAWDDDDDTYTNDFYCAMTGDFIIRIAQGTTVARGDLLMSAGDGTAKPQDDDIVRSKTIAKVTSTTVSTTYSDGSYCVPCVLMAC